MNRTDLRALIQEIVASVLAAQALPRRALVALSGGRAGYDEVVRQLALLHTAGFALDLVQTDAARQVFDQGALHAVGLHDLSPRSARDHELLIVGCLTANTAAKIANGMADNDVTNAVTEFLCSGRPVVAVRSAACPDDLERRLWYPSPPEAYRSVLRRNLETLTALGVRLTDAHLLRDTVLATWTDRVHAGTPSPVLEHRAGPVHPRSDDVRPVVISDRLISHTTLQAMPTGARLRVGRTAIVTSLASDTARDRSITIERESER
jgi:hypothetical protein